MDLRMQACLSVGLIASLLVLCQCQLTIPARELGFVYNEASPDAPVKLASYIDLTCPDSKAAFPSLLAVADYFGPQTVQLKLHLFSLPYHRNSHVISKAAHVLDAFKSPQNSTVYDWFEAVYDKIDSLTTSATVNLSDVQVLDYLTSLAENLTGISAADFKAGVGHTDIDLATRLGWKYGCTRGVYGTPLFSVNDVFVQADPNWTVTQWIDLIKPLIGGR